MEEVILGPIKAVLHLLLVLAFIMAEATMVVLVFRPLVTIERLLKQLLVDLRGRLGPLTIIHPFSSCML
jgi:hypothetical protein